MPWPAEKVKTGDLVTAAQLNRLPILLAQETLVADAASVTFASIPADWTTLELVIYGRGTETGFPEIGVRVRFNGSATAIYDRQRISASAAAISTDESFAETSLAVGLIPTAGGSASKFGVVRALIPAYATTVGHKPVQSESSEVSGTTTGTATLQLFGGLWRNTAAISEITVLLVSGSFLAGSMFSLHGRGTL